MRKTGTVAQINRDRCMVAIATDIGYTIIEVTPKWELDVGDLLAWEDGLHIGPTIYENLTRATRDGVFVRDHGVAGEALADQLLR
jgi:hypothetical protein